MASSDTKMFTVDKFLGVNEAADGSTELKMGEASKMENFLITDAYNLAVRPGVRRAVMPQDRTPAQILAIWAGFVGDLELLAICDFNEEADSFGDRLFLFTKLEDGSFHLYLEQDGWLKMKYPDPYVKFMLFNGKLYVMTSSMVLSYDTVDMTEATIFNQEGGYIPLVITGASPAGGGTQLESINLLSRYRKIEYSADGTSSAYVLPSEAVTVETVTVDNVKKVPSYFGSYDAETNTFTFTNPPEKGVGNVTITYGTDETEAEENWMRIARCRLSETYNGATDTRLFLAGDGTNICYYSGVTRSGEATAMYFPAMHEVAVDMSGSHVTGLRRHYSKLLVFKPDGTYTISYEPVTLADGSTIAGFYLRAANRDFGNEAMGQVQTVNNYPRTVTKNGIYEWRITSSYYRDERYAVRVSGKVEQSLKGADLNKIVTCDDDFSKTYYVFLNDDLGTVLVNRYGLGKDGVWCVYRSELCRNVIAAMMHGGQMVFANQTEIFCFDESATKDAAITPDGESMSIRCIWESGYMDFGQNYRRKYSSILYVSILPQPNSEVIITAVTDKRADYMEKAVENNVFQWSRVSFPNWTFNTNDRPKISRVRLKVKKFVYYKLVFRVEKEGGQGTILGFDQQVRFASMAK